MILSRYEHTLTNFYHEDGGDVLFRNVGKYLHDYRHHNPEGHNPRLRRSENLKSHVT
jgi:hypothetical protein